MSHSLQAQHALEIVVLMEDSIHEVRYLTTGQSWSLPDGTTLVEAGPAGFILHIASGVTGTTADQPVVPGATIRISDKFSARLSWGVLTLVLTAGAAPARAHLPPRWIDWRAQRASAAVAMLGGIVALLAAAAPPQPMSLTVDPFSDALRRPIFVLKPPEPEPQKAAGGATSGPRAARPEGKARPNVRQQKPAVAPPRMSTATAQAQARTLAADSGVLGMLHNETSQLGAIFHDSGALSDASNASLDSLVGTEVGEGGAPGYLGSGTRGNGPGGGGDSIHAGDPGRSGPGDRRGNCPKGAKCDVLASRDVGKIDRLGPPVVIVKGPPDRDLFRRVIRQHRNEVRFCYERQLSRSPELSGRLLMHFTIAPSGQVLEAKVDQTSLTDSAVGQCVSEAIRRWTFPKLDQMAIIQYPFVFSPAGS